MSNITLSALQTNAEEALARICAELTKQGIEYSVRENFNDQYVIEIRGF